MTLIAPAVPGKTLHSETLMDGATSIAEVIERLEIAANYLRTLDHDGWSFEEDEVTDGYATLVDPNGDILCCNCAENLIPARGQGECRECAPDQYDD